MSPFVFRPLLKRIRWGGTRLGTRLGKAIGEATDVAESWEVVDHGDDQSVVLGGPFDGWTLGKLVAERNDELFGRHAGLSQFPLLIKFLDATDRLSVQVHPDDAGARRHDPTENGKTEAWVVLDAEPGSLLYAGLRAGIDGAAYDAAVAADRVADCLHSFAVSAGDAVFIPAGTVHAIGEGVLLAEVQQSSDLTFRIHDWGRVGSDGQPRELHVGAARECIDFERGPVSPVVPRPVDGLDHPCELLVDCPQFVLRRHTIEASSMFAVTNRARVLMVLGGGGTLDDGVRPVALPLGTTALLPAAATECRFTPDSPTILLEAFSAD